MNITTTQINTAISTATINGNFNSDLIENVKLKKLAIQEYINRIAESGESSVLNDYQKPIESQTATPLDSSTVIIGGKTALIIEKSQDYILAKFDSPTFSDKAYFTISYVEGKYIDEENKGISFFSGHYDLDLTTAINDFNKRIGK
tara:strand:+ start:104 stop:541 length:438 start_codon:yes stop_codon:yes gene_type:complete